VISKIEKKLELNEDLVSKEIEVIENKIGNDKFLNAILNEISKHNIIKN